MGVDEIVVVAAVDLGALVDVADDVRTQRAVDEASLGLGIVLDHLL
jgi:hypothetical protein